MNRRITLCCHSLGIAVGALLLAVDSAAFGTIFTSPQQRALLDEKRRGGVQMRIESVQERRARTHLQGLVVRGGGRGSVWLDGRLASEKESRKSGAEIMVESKALRISGNRGSERAAKALLLKPGQVWLEHGDQQIREHFDVRTTAVAFDGSEARN